ncbi:MAG: sulfate adenylyltransferase subunit CysN [Deltaproteobacteria bacterium]|nr:MAG: sulfate adenylyltransferase subunit CysN [Deltaproteobacteria bacterium]
MATVDAAAQDAELIRTDISAYLDKYEQKELLRFVAVGSVDDGKSTLIGRLLHDTGMVYEDQLEAVKRASNLGGEDEIDFSLLTDGLRAEREQGITIDVAYRYFSTDKRKFIIADTPGHIQYTRNMVTGASTANVGLILIDARLGVLQQSRRHATIASLIGIPHLAVCVNKMDLTNFDQDGFNAIRDEFMEFAKDLRFKDVTFFPISALKGDNIVTRSERTPWHDGPHILEYLESVPVSADANLTDFRFPVQTVLRPNLNYRGFAGQITSGTIKVGDKIMTLPSGKTSKVAGIDKGDVSVDEAFSPQSVVIRLEDEIDTSRGDMFVKVDNTPDVQRTVEAHLVWMSETALDTEKSYLLKHTTQTVRAEVEEIEWKLDMDTLERVESATLDLNDIGYVRITCTHALYTDPYVQNRGTGSFILIDSATNNTVAAGMVGDRKSRQDLEDLLKEARAGSALPPKTQVSPRERFDRLGQRGATLWLTGLPGSGRWALAYALERRLFDEGRTATCISPKGQDLDGMIAAAKAATEAGLIAICAYPSYHIADRELVREKVGAERMFHVYVNTDPKVCRERRPNADFSGFEPPRTPQVEVSLEHGRLLKAVDTILDALAKGGQFERPTH